MEQRANTTFPPSTSKLKRVGILKTLSFALAAMVATVACDDGAGDANTTSLGVEGDWELTFQDEFDWLDLNRYNTEYIWPREQTINNEEQFYVDPNIHGVNPFTTEGGILKITAQRTPDHVRWATGKPYVSGVLTSRHKGHSQQYGRFEIRAKLPRGKGLWPAFWLLPTHDQWPAGVSTLAELDIMEYLGHEGSMYHTTRHTNSLNSEKQHGTYVETGANLNDEFHRYGVIWDASRIKWYFDDRIVFESATPDDFHHPKHFLLNLAVGGSWPGSPDGNTAFPSAFEVDYVRIYKRRGEQSNPSQSQPQSGARLEKPSGIYNSLYDSRTAEIFWQSASNYPGDTQYNVYRNGEYLTTTSGKSYFAAGLDPNSGYTFEVEAIANGRQTSERARTDIRGGSGNQSQPNNNNNNQPTGATQAPTNLRGSVYSSRAIEIFWNSSTTPGVMRYEIRRNGAVIDNREDGGGSYFDASVQPGNAYNYTVIAIGQDGSRSQASNSWSGNTPY